MLLIILFSITLVFLFIIQHVDYLKNNITEKQFIYQQYKKGNITYKRMKKDIKDLNQ